MDLFIFNNCIDVVIIVMGVIVFCLYFNIEVLVLEIIYKFWLDIIDIVIFISSFFNISRLFMDYLIMG